MNSSNTLLPAIGQPATRALAAQDITSLEQVAKLAPEYLLSLHGVGNKAIEILRQSLHAQGLDFAVA